MSKLVDKLNQVGKTVPQPIGFGFRSTPAQKAVAMILAVSLPRNDAELAKAAVMNGADTLIVHIDIEDHASGNRFGSLDQERAALEQILHEAGETPVGIVPGDAGLSADRLNELQEMKFDFISAYAHQATAALLKMKNVGRGIVVDNSYSDVMLRTLDEIPCDMVEADVLPPEQDGQALSVQDVMLYTKLGILVRKPLLVPTQHTITPDDLPLLQEAGVEGIILDFVVTGDTPESLGAITGSFRKAINALKPRRPRRERETVILPAPSAHPAEPEQEPEEPSIEP